MSKIINLFGGPGAGKSTSASYVFYLLKTLGLNAELVREYVKDWAWEDRKIADYDQFLFLGKQSRREALLYGKVDYIVTDSPVLLNVYYSQRFTTMDVSEGIRAAVLAYYRKAAADGHQHINVFLKRSKPYVKAGRWQDEEQAKFIDGGVRALLDQLRMPFVEYETTEDDLRRLVQSVIE